MPTQSIRPASTTGQGTLSDANRLTLDFQAEAGAFGLSEPIIDIHTHISSPASAAVYFQAARDYGVAHAFTMTGLPNVQPIRASLSQEDNEALHFICVPDYQQRDKPGTFTTQWHKDIESFYAAGSRIIKFWSAPRAIQFADGALKLGSPNTREAMRIAYDTGYRVCMTHIGDPDTWFATHYTDRETYGTKADQYRALEGMLDEYGDVTWIGAHMGGNPEDLDWLHDFLSRHPNYVVDTSATKWQVRELGKQPKRLREFIEANPGRVLFGSDIVASEENVNADPDSPEAGFGYDLYASRYWALRALLETDYAGPSPIVDPDLHMVDPSAVPKATALMQGAALPDSLLRDVYCDAPGRILDLIRASEVARSPPARWVQYPPETAPRE